MQKIGQALIAGSGPAGLMAAESLARAGLEVRIFERMASPARKFLMAGRGGLNLTHSEALDGFLRHYGPDEKFLAPAIRDFPPQALMEWAQGLGISLFTGSSGRVFPEGLKASPLLRAWLRHLQDLGVQIETGREWRGETADVTILAMGGASWPRLGSNGAWVDILRARDIQVNDFKPSNCGILLDWKPEFAARFAGQPLKRIAVSYAGHVVKGEAMITAKGLEGGAIYALSRFIRDGLETGPISLSLDLKPEWSLEAFQSRLANARAGESLANRLRKIGLTGPAAWLAREGKIAQIQVHGLAGLERAISSAGGVAMAEVDEFLMLRKWPGVFVAGEMLDWEAPTGGYLLQASFATAKTAAKGALNWLKTHQKGS